ncbi:MAG: nucleotide-binding protein [Candidatus Ranarchaeia archaeon]
MKIAVAGKGGTGKTTLSAVLARLLARQGYTVLALDNDSSPNLALALGFPPDAAAEIVPLANQKEFARERTGVSPKEAWGTVFKLNPKVDDIVDKFGVHGPDNVRLLVLGAIEQGGRGCFCPENALLKALLHHVLIGRKDIVVLDLEAGVEHLGRASSRGVDLMLIMIEPGIRSIQIASQITKLARDIGITNIQAVLNRIRSADDVRRIKEKLVGVNIPVIGELPFDDSLIRADLAGKSPIDYDPDSPTVQAISRICETIIKELV